MGELEHDGYRPTLRAGLHLGRPRKLRGDYLGVDVNVAARVAEARRRGRAADLRRRAGRAWASARAWTPSASAASRPRARPASSRCSSSGRSRPAPSTTPPCGPAWPPGSRPAPPAESTSPRVGCGGTSSCAASTPKCLASTARHRLDLHLAEAGQRGQVGAQRAGVRGVGPHAGGVAVRRCRAGARPGRAPGRPSSRGSGGRRAWPGTPARGRRSARVPASSEPRRSLITSGPAKRLLDRDLLVEREAHQQRHRVRCDQRVRLVVLGEVEPVAARCDRTCRGVRRPAGPPADDAENAV